ncbi:MAG: DUF4340 domain-containing protein [Verrucomicrobiaceae bacterium]|nr:MAG: DUF4340 domain-containing protein [Verrucomicrobiaceae bacterium]
MNKRQVIILWAIAIGLGAAVTTVKISQNKATKSATERKSGDPLFATFPGAEAATVEIQGAGSSVTLTKKDGKWVVADRGNYPANPTFVNEFLRTLGDLKITQAMEAGPSFAPRFGMDEASSKADERGLTATFKDASGKELAKIGLGKNIESGAAPSTPMGGMGAGAVGRYVRNYADDSGFYAVGEMFPSVSAEAKRWLADGFINPEKITSISVSKPGKDEIDWKLSRETDEAAFKLENAAAGELPDTSVTDPLKSLFSYARFEDVVPADKVADRIVADSKQNVVIETQEGFRYSMTITATKPVSAPAATQTPAVVPPPSDNYLVTVDVTADLPKERKKEEGEKPEDATTKDAAFTERHKALTEKLSKEKALSGVTFEVAKTTVEPILKDRKALTTKPEPTPAPGGEDQGSVQQLPGGMIARPPATATTPPIQAVTPPISVPAADEQEQQDSGAAVKEEAVKEGEDASEEE